MSALVEGLFFALSKRVLATERLCWEGWWELKLEVFVSTSGFPADANFYSSIGVPGCHGVQKCDRSVIFFFHCKFGVFINWVKVGVQLCKVFTSNADVAIIEVSIPPLRRVGAVIKALSLTCSITADGHFACACSAESILMWVTADMRLLCVFANRKMAEKWRWFYKQIFRRWK